MFLKNLESVAVSGLQWPPYLSVYLNVYLCAIEHEICFGGVALEDGLKGGGEILFCWILSKSRRVLLVSPTLPI